MTAYRLDKLLSLDGARTRSEAKRLLRAGRVTVDGAVETDGARKVDADAQSVAVSGAPLHVSAVRVYMLHKPAGVLTAARDRKQPTVMELLPPSFAARSVLPVGRLDKDTTGLLLLTNDGALAHALLSPKRHVPKRYLATLAGRLTEADVAAFAAGVRQGDFAAKPARLEILAASDAESRAQVTVYEGQFHQIKRMFHAVGHEVTALHRAAFGGLELDAALAPGAYRELTAEELRALRERARGEAAETLP